MSNLQTPTGSSLRSSSLNTKQHGNEATSYNAGFKCIMPTSLPTVRVSSVLEQLNYLVHVMTLHLCHR